MEYSNSSLSCRSNSRSRQSNISESRLNSSKKSNSKSRSRSNSSSSKNVSQIKEDNKESNNSNRDDKYESEHSKSISVLQDNSIVIEDSNIQIAFQNLNIEEDSKTSNALDQNLVLEESQSNKTKIINDIHHTEEQNSEIHCNKKNKCENSTQKGSKIPDYIKAMCEIIEDVSDFDLYKCFSIFKIDDSFNKEFSDQLKTIKTLNKDLNFDKIYFDSELHYFEQENVDCIITVFKGNAKLLENILYTQSFYKSAYKCCINKAKDLWINKREDVYWHNFKNYDPNYSISKKEIIVHYKKRHYNCAEFHFKHNCLLCFKAVYKYMSDMNMRLYDLFDCDISKQRK